MARRRHQEVSLVVFEVKFSREGHASEIADQLCRYEEVIVLKFDELRRDAERVFKLKNGLGLFAHFPQGDAIATLTFSQNPNDVIYAAVIADLEPEGRVEIEKKLSRLHFRNRVHLFFVGYGLWAEDRKRFAGPIG
jgi:hypothetical protein